MDATQHAIIDVLYRMSWVLSIAGGITIMLVINHLILSRRVKVLEQQHRRLDGETASNRMLSTVRR